MLFDSYIFIFAFLPITLGIYFLLTSYNFFKTAINWLIFASLFFYAWWNPKYLVLIILSIMVNYYIGLFIIKYYARKKMRALALYLGLIFNLGLIVFYKYTNFFVENLNYFGADINVPPIILPLAISFFTFQQIAYLVDVNRGYAKKYRFSDYCLFVTFFPQLIAGPIVQHNQIISQFGNLSNLQFSSKSISVGFTIFLLGLVKKVGLADYVAVYANTVFDSATKGIILSFWESWFGAFAYSVQLYFDFSGYSDMAVGLGLMFGIKLPANFNSPYKAVNIIDFWRRWHITLSTFLRDYLYIPLGGNKYGAFKRYINIFITMVIGGLWHGANWTFVVWGGMHGFFIIINHFWRGLTSKYLILFWAKNKKLNILYQMITFLAVVSAWVLFKAENIKVAISILRSMYLFNGLSFPNSLLRNIEILKSLGLETRGMFYNGLADWYNGVLMIGVLILIVLKTPNTLEIMRRFYPSDYQVSTEVKGNIISSVWYPSKKWAFITSLLFLVAIMLISEENEFLYFQF